MAWLKALAEDALKTGGRQVVEVAQRKILLLNHEGQVYAIANQCPHLKLPMNKGKITDGAIVCPWHRSAFDLCTGEVKDWTPFPPVVGKVMAMVSAEKTLPVFPTRVEDGSIWVDVE
jgi:nitrite reductase/ring-hydroxylating ferredoxin subunit